ncbi:NAD(P)-binding protein, partial [Aureobasidium melanogenum]
MQFSVGDVLQLLDKTLLSPLLTLSIPIALHLSGRQQIVIARASNSVLGWNIVKLPSLQKKAIALAAIATLLRLNSYASQRALNNAVVAHFKPKREIVVVTGGAGGFGAAATLKLAAEGATVVVLDVLPLTYPKPPGVHYYKVDLTNLETLEAVAKQIRQEVGEPTAVIANAGICRGKPLLEATARDVELTFGVNSIAVVWCAKVFLPAMVRENHGHFLITASQGAFVATSHITDYAATKAAALALYEGIQTELKHVYKAPAVRCSVICPAVANTKMFGSVVQKGNFFMPALEASDIGDRMCEILKSANSQQVVMPAMASIAVVLRMMPTWMRINAQDAAAEAMLNLNPHDPMANV